MSERKKFVLLLTLLVLSVALVVFVRSSIGQDFVQSL